MTYTTEQLSEMSSSQLVNLYNELTGGSVSRFATKDAGIRRILRAYEDFAHEEPEVAVEEVVAVDEPTPVVVDEPQKFFPLVDDGSRTRAYVALCDRIKGEYSGTQWKAWKAEVYNVHNNMMTLEGEDVSFTTAEHWAEVHSAPEAGKPVEIPVPAASTPATAKTTGKRDAYDHSHVISLLVAENPKRKGSASHDRFAKYRSGMTVADALSAGVTREDINWDVKHDFIAVEAAKTATTN